jgi:hypothetical protein
MITARNNPSSVQRKQTPKTFNGQILLQHDLRKSPPA